ncbi:MAG: helix-turn-helix domain-containing protein [Clostridiales bacterium]|jgi:two-component system response regulator YesN|nr:helix-turn-helix domain-containing protein [Clostridiales bacterium]
MKIMIADTDIDTIKNFRLYLRHSFPHMKVVSSITDVNAFKPETDSSKPDIILADIRFFGAAGHSLIRETYELNPNIKFIVYGTYNDIEYIEKVMEYGVIDYMFRPVKPPEFDRCIRKAEKVLEDVERAVQEKQELLDNYRQRMELFQDRFLINLLHGHLDDEYEISASLKYFGINIKEGYRVFVMRIDHYKQVMLLLEDDAEKHLLIYQMLRLTEERIKRLSGGGFAMIYRFNMLIIVIGGDVPTAESANFCEELKNDISARQPFTVTIGAGRTYKKAADIVISLREAEAALRYRHFVGYNSVIFLQYVEPNNNVTYRYPAEREKSLIYSAVAGEYATCVTQLARLIKSLEEIEMLPEKLAGKITLYIVVAINRLTAEQHLPVPDKFNFMQFFPTKALYEIETLDHMQQYLTETLKNYCAKVNELRSTRKISLLEEAKNYIRLNFAENIKLADVARKIKTTPDFLSAIFNEFENMSAYDYIISVRMKEAKRLMRELNLDDERTAFAVGYQDVKYFRSIFKQKEGLFTHEYRAEARARYQ